MADQLGLTVLRGLLPEGSDVDGQDGDGRAPLWHAAHRGELGVVVHLAHQLGASVTLADGDGRSPLYAAAGYEGGGGHLKVVQWLAGNGGSVAQPNNNGVTPLSVAAQYGHLEVVKWLAGNGGSVAQPNNHGVTPLCGAAQEGHLEVVQWLAGNGGSVAQPDNDGCTPLSVAAQYGHLEVVAPIMSS